MWLSADAASRDRTTPPPLAELAICGSPDIHVRRNFVVLTQCLERPLLHPNGNYTASSVCFCLATDGKSYLCTSDRDHSSCRPRKEHNLALPEVQNCGLQAAVFEHHSECRFFRGILSLCAGWSNTCPNRTSHYGWRWRADMERPGRARLQLWGV